MREITGDIWDYHSGHWIVITTNGTVKTNGECVMGRGVAAQAKDRFPTLPRRLGGLLSRQGNRLFMFPDCRILTFPVKHNWWEKADMGLIEQSVKGLLEFRDFFQVGDIYMVRPGCSNGRLDWKDVKPVLERYLDDRFIVVELINA